MSTTWQRRLSLTAAVLFAVIGLLRVLSPATDAHDARCGSSITWAIGGKSLHGGELTADQRSELNAQCTRSARHNVLWGGVNLLTAGLFTASALRLGARRSVGRPRGVTGAGAASSDGA